MCGWGGFPPDWSGFISKGKRILGIQHQARGAWSIARLMRDGFSHLRFRKSVLLDPVLTGTTLDDIIYEPEGLARFLARCEGVPGCGGVQIETIAAALVTELEQQANLALAAGDDGRAQRLQAIAERTDPEATDQGVTLVGALYSDAITLEDLALRLWQQSLARRFFYMPASLPDCVKIPALFQAERGGAATQEPSGPKVWRDAFGQAAMRARGAQGLILLDGHVLQSLRVRCGCYGGLSPEDVETQMAMLLEFCADMPPGLEVLVTDLEQARLSPGAILGDVVVMPGPGGAAVFPDPPGLAQMIVRCATARAAARPLAEVLKTAS